MYNLRKIRIQEIIKSDFNLHLTHEEEFDSTIKQQESPLFLQMNKLRGSDSLNMQELVLVEARHDRKREEELKKMLREGFILNNIHYVRYGKSASQAKDGITLFIDSKYYDEMTRRSLLDLKPDKVVISKFESYRNLILSSCLTVDKELPYIVIVDEFEKVISNQYIRYAENEKVTFPDKKTGKLVEFDKKVIKEGYQDIEISPFDGFGVHMKNISRKINKNVGLRGDTILYQIRLPMMKGVSVEFDFKRFYRERGVHEITDVFGHKHKLKNIDCIWNVSMWKGYKDFKKEYGENGWKQYINKVKEYDFKLGISKYNHHMDDIDWYSRLNFQYLQCMDLWNEKYINKFKSGEENFKNYNILDRNNWGKVINIAKYSTDLVEKIVKGDKLYTLKFLGMNQSDKDDVKSNYVEAIKLNDRMLRDPVVKKMLRNKLSKTITEMKYGKIFAEGFYHTVIGDVIGYLEYAAGLEVKGCLNEGEFHANTLAYGDCLSLRSPLVDPSEVHRVKLVHNDYTNKYFRHFYKKDVCMINMYDLTMQIQGGMDEDGDQVFLSNNEIMLDSKINIPSVIDLTDKEMTDPEDYSDIENMINYECKSRDNRIGEITNVATSILNQYTEDEKWIKRNADNIAWLRLAQGKEIDYLKTGKRWIIPKFMRKYLEKLPYFLLYNYPKKMNSYNKIKDKNRGRSKNTRLPYNVYHSPSPLNELCEFICEWENHNIVWDNDLNNNYDIVIDHSLDLSDKDIIKKLNKIYIYYTNKLKDEIRKDDDSNFDQIKESCLNEMRHIIFDQQLLANYCIKIAYRSISKDKTLCWLLFSNEILENLKENSYENNFKIIKTDKSESGSQEFLGKYYKIIKE